MKLQASLIYSVAIFGANAHGKGGKKKAEVDAYKGEPFAYCPPGYEMIGQRCETTETAEPEIICPQGFDFYNGECVDYGEWIWDCPPGFMMRGRICTRNIYADRQVFCPSGFEMSTYRGGKGKKGGGLDCVAEIPVPLEAICPSDCLSHGRHECYVHDYIDATPVCPLDFWMSPDYSECIQECEYDCTPQEYVVKSKKMKKYKGKGRKLGGKKGKKIQKYPVASIDTAVLTQICVDTIAQPVTYECPPGSILSGCQCRIEVPAPLEYFCPAMGDDVYCYSLEYAQLEATCPLGYELQCQGKKKKQSCDCVAVEEVAATCSCPSNTIQRYDECILLELPRTVCPRGFDFHEMHGICVRTIMAEPILEWSVDYVCEGAECFGKEKVKKSKGKGKKYY